MEASHHADHPPLQRGVGSGSEVVRTYASPSQARRHSLSGCGDEFDRAMQCLNNRAGGASPSTPGTWSVIEA